MPTKALVGTTQVSLFDGRAAPVPNEGDQSRQRTNGGDSCEDLLGGGHVVFLSSCFPMCFNDDSKARPRHHLDGPIRATASAVQTRDCVSLRQRAACAHLQHY